MPKLLSKEEIDKISFEYAGSMVIHDLIYTIEIWQEVSKTLCENEDDCRKLLVENGIVDHSDSWGVVMIIELIELLLEREANIKSSLLESLNKEFQNQETNQLLHEQILSLRRELELVRGY